MTEREIYLMELALEGELTPEEKNEFEQLLISNPEIKSDF